MWTSIRTKRIQISSRQRQMIENFIRRTFQREQRHIGSVIVTLSPAKIGGSDLGFTCQLRIWSPFLGTTSVSDIGDTVRTAVQQASLRTREALRRRLHKRHDGARRIGRRRFQTEQLLEGLPISIPQS